MTAKKLPKRRQEDRERENSNGWGRLVQVVAIIAIVVLAIIDLSDHTSSVPAYIYGGLLGIAIGAKPEDIMRLRK